MSIGIIGTLDTKGPEIEFARDVIVSTGIDVHIVDAGVIGEPTIEADTDREQVARRGGSSLTALRDAGDRGPAIETMAAGAAATVRSLYDEGELDGVLGLGGSAGTTIGTTAMRALPFGVPKVMLSTMASGNTRNYVESSDITMMYSVADIAGVNSITRRVISNAAHATVGMIGADVPSTDEAATTIAVTMFGVTTPGVTTAREFLESHGYEVITFHATGTGGQAMESLIRDGEIDAVLDFTTTELADELVGGVLSAGPDRLEAAGERGIPQVISVGALDMVNFGPKADVPERFWDRTLHEHNPTVTLMRTTPEENAELGQILAEKANQADGPVAIGLPLGGVSLIDEPGEDFYDPGADEALFEAIREHAKVELFEIDATINSDEFALAAARKLLEFVEQ